jgi:hypothetical protein
MNQYVSQAWVIYNYDDVVTLPYPRPGEHVLIANSPYYSTYPIIITGDGVSSWDELLKRVFNVPVLTLPDNNSYVPQNGQVVGIPLTIDSKTFIHPITGDGISTVAQLATGAQISTATLAQMIITETNARTTKDSSQDALINQALALATGSGKGIVFDTTAQLDSWLAGTYTRPDGQTVSDLVIGESIYIIAVGEPDYWWAGSQYYEQETSIDLSDYRRATDQDTIDALKAPLYSPNLTGIPTTPIPDGNTDLQIVPWKYLDNIRKTLDDRMDIIAELQTAAEPPGYIGPELEGTETPPIYFGTEFGDILSLEY